MANRVVGPSTHQSSGPRDVPTTVGTGGPVNGEPGVKKRFWDINNLEIAKNFGVNSVGLT
jgi:hypothetical protein